MYRHKMVFYTNAWSLRTYPRPIFISLYQYWLYPWIVWVWPCHFLWSTEQIFKFHTGKFHGNCWTRVFDTDPMPNICMLDPTPVDWIIKTFPTVLDVLSEYLIPTQRPLTTIPGPMYIWEKALFRAHTYSETVPYPWDLEHRKISMHSASFSLSTAKLFLRLISVSLVAWNESMDAESLSGYRTDDSFCR